jgi:C4-dicarboxylate-specific signal transduction histidine kinase
VSPVAESSAERISIQGRFISDVLHKLSQPLTALHCSLQLSLERDQTADEFRVSVEAALHNAERLRENLLLLRELCDADDPGDISAPVQLQELLQETQQDFLPVCESAGGCFTVRCGPVQVRGNGAKLRRAFFYLLECLLRRYESRSLGISVKRKNGRVQIRLAFSGAKLAAIPMNDACDPIATGEMEIARRTFRAVGGDLAAVESAGRSTGCIVKLLVAK